MEEEGRGRQEEEEAGGGPFCPSIHCLCLTHLQLFLFQAKVGEQLVTRKMTRVELPDQGFGKIH